MDKKALKESGKKWVDVTVKNVKKIFDDPTGVKKFVKDYKSSKKKHQRTKSRMAQRTGNKYMIDKGTTYVKPKVKTKAKQSKTIAKKYFKGSF